MSADDSVALPSVLKYLRISILLTFSNFYSTKTRILFRHTEFMDTYLYTDLILHANRNTYEQDFNGIG